LIFNSIVGDANGGSIVTMDGGFGLGVPKLVEGQLKNHSLFAIQEEGPKFGFCSRSDDEPKDCAQRKKCTI
jgi:hypothetical protein